MHIFGGHCRYQQGKCKAVGCQCILLICYPLAHPVLVEKAFGLQSSALCCAMQAFGHAAGAIGKDAIPTISPDQFYNICSPKIAIDALLASSSMSQLPLQEMALFSSTAAAWSQPEASHYSAANSALDAISSRCRQVLELDKPCCYQNFNLAEDPSLSDDAHMQVCGSIYI